MRWYIADSSFWLVGLLVPAAFAQRSAPQKHFGAAALRAESAFHYSAAQRRLTADCLLTAGQGQCRGVLRPQFTADDLKSSYGADWPGYDGRWATNRQWSCVPGDDDRCPLGLKAEPSNNPESRNYNPANLSGSQAILIGVIKWDENSKYKDRRYRIGDKLTGDARLSYIVATAPRNGMRPKLPQGQVVAEWNMYTIAPDDPAPRWQKKGRIFLCTVPHPSNDVVESHFFGCSAQVKLQALATKMDLPLSELLDLRPCDLVNANISEQNSASRQNDGSCATPRVKTGKSLLPAIRRLSNVEFDTLVATLADHSIDAYWYSCANGCCTADM